MKKKIKSENLPHGTREPEAIRHFPDTSPNPFDLPNDPVLIECRTSISNFLIQLTNFHDDTNITSDTSGTFQTTDIPIALSDKSFIDDFNEIIIDLTKIIQNNPKCLAAAALDAKWRRFSNLVQFHVQQLNQRNKSKMIMKHITAIKTTVKTVHSAAPIAQAAKKEHNSLYLQIKKNLSLIEHSAELNDEERSVLQLRKFRSDLSHHSSSNTKINSSNNSYVKFFQLSQLDRNASIAAVNDIKKNIDQILRILAGTNQLIILPTEFRSLSRFVNEMKIKSTFGGLSTIENQKKNQKTILPRSKTPPARIVPIQKIRPYATNSTKTTISSEKTDKTKPKTSSKSSKTMKTAGKGLIMGRSKTPPSRITTSLNKSLNMNGFRGKPLLLQSSTLKKDEITTAPNSSRRRKTAKIHRKESLNISKLPSTINQHHEPSSSSSVKSTASTTATISTMSTTTTTMSTKTANLKAGRSPISKRNMSNRSITPPKREIPLINSIFNSGSLSTTLHSNQQKKTKTKAKTKANMKETSNNSDISKNDKVDNLNSQKNEISSSSSTRSITNLAQTAMNIRCINSNNKAQTNASLHNHSSQSFDSETDQLVLAVTKAKAQAREKSPTLEKLQHELSRSDFLMKEDPPRSKDSIFLSTTNNNNINGNININPRINIERTYKGFYERIKKFDQLMLSHELIVSFSNKADRNIKLQNHQQLEFDLSIINEKIASLHSNEKGDNKIALKIGQSLSQYNKQIEDCFSDKFNFEYLKESYNQLNKMIQTGKWENNSNFISSETANFILAGEILDNFINEKLLNNPNSIKNEKNEIEILKNEINHLKVELSKFTDNENIEESVENNFEAEGTEDQSNTIPDINQIQDIELENIPISKIYSVKKNLSNNLKNLKTLHEDEIIQLKKNKVINIRKRISLRQELESIQKQLIEVHNSIMHCGKNKTVAYQFKIIPKEELEATMYNLFDQEAKILNEINATSS